MNATPLSQVEANTQSKLLKSALAEAGKAVVDHETACEKAMLGLACNGNVLIEGLPGTGKTLLVKTLATIAGCSFSRIQFTPDLLPSDIVGITSYSKTKGFYTVKGPVFANFVLASGINRAPPKVQSALLEAMQERQVTIGKQTHQLPQPFFVMATQNPIESLGTYPLPDAQVDRFLFKLQIGHCRKQDERRLLEREYEGATPRELGVKEILTPEKIRALQDAVRRVHVDEKVKKYIVTLVDATRNPKAFHVKHAEAVEWGSSPRASISLYIAAKAKALLDGRNYATPNHVKQVAHDVLRHRIVFNYQGQAEELSHSEFIDGLLEKVPVE